MIYIPRTLVNEDELFGEDTISKFTEGNAIEMYIESVDGFEGEETSSRSLVLRSKTP